MSRVEVSSEQTVSAQEPRREVAPPSEQRWEFVNMDAISISSSPGAGSSTQAEMMKTRFNIPTLQLWKIGDLRRQADFDRTGKLTEEINESDPQLELDTDKVTQRLLRQATTEAPIIVEAQLGGYVATKLVEQAKRNHKAPPRIKRFLLVVAEDQGAERVKDREEKRGNVEANQYSVDAWKLRNRHRHFDRDLKNWRKAYPELRGIDIHDANAMEKDGVTPIWKRYYDYVIDTTDLTPQQIHSQMIISLWEDGHVRPIAA